MRSGCHNAKTKYALPDGLASAHHGDCPIEPHSDKCERDYDKSHDPIPGGDIGPLEQPFEMASRDGLDGERDQREDRCESSEGDREVNEPSCRAAPCSRQLI